MAVLLHAKQAMRGGRGMVLPTLNSAARNRWVVNTIPQWLYPQQRDLVPTVQEAGWVFRPVWKGLENFAPTGV